MYVRGNVGMYAYTYTHRVGVYFWLMDKSKIEQLSLYISHK